VTVLTQNRPADVTVGIIRPAVCCGGIKWYGSKTRWKLTD